MISRKEHDINKRANQANSFSPGLCKTSIASKYLFKDFLSNICTTSMKNGFTTTRTNSIIAGCAFRRRKLPFGRMEDKQKSKKTTTDEKMNIMSK